MAVITTPVLISPQDSEPFCIEADSSNFATDTILSQQSTADIYSKFLFLVKRNYKIHDKEILAIICTLEEWRHFLEKAANPVQI